VRTDRAAQERLIHWGYAVCDAAMRRHLVAQGDARLWITW
jgi:NTE family protein